MLIRSIAFSKFTTCSLLVNLVDEFTY